MSTTTLMIAILGTGVSLAGLMIGLIAWLRVDMRRVEERLSEDISVLHKDVSDLRERMAHLEGLLEGLREAIVRRAA